MSEIVDRLRQSLILENQAEAVRFIAERDERIAELERQLTLERHRVTSLRWEISARSAAASQSEEEIRALHDKIRELMRESAEGAEPNSEFRSRQSRLELSVDCLDGNDREPPTASLRKPVTNHTDSTLEAPGRRSEKVTVGGLIDDLLSDKCMIPADVPGIYQYCVRPLSKRAARMIEKLLNR